MMTTLDQLATYASVMWEPEDLIEIRPLKPWGATRFWCKASELHYHVENMQAENERGHNMYAGACPRTRDGGGTSEDVAGGRVLWADFDHCDPTEAIRVAGEVGLPIASMVVSTGHGAHLFWRIESWLPKEEHKAAMAALTDFLLSREETKKYTDKSVKDPARILRLPGFTNHKPPVAKAEIVYADPSARHALTAFPAAIQKPAAVPSATMQGDDGAIERARRYLAMIQGSGKGGRTTTAFRAACVLVNDMGLDSGTALQMLSGWDAAANSPSISSDYPEGELSKIIENAKKYAKKPAGCKKAHDDSDVDLSGILAQFEAQEPDDEDEPQEERKRAPKFPTSLLDVPGFMARVMEYTIRTSHRPQPVLALAGAIALQATLAGRKVCDESGTRTNLYILALAPSGAGKDRPRAVNDEILTRSGAESLLGAEDFASDSGIISALLQNPTQLFQGDEIGLMLKQIANSKNEHLQAIPSLLMKLFTKSNGIYRGKAYADAKKREPVKYPCVSIFGTSIPDNVFNGLTIENLSDGFFARMVIFESRQYPPLVEKVDSSEPSHQIIEISKWWHDFNPFGNLHATTTPETGLLSPKVIKKTDQALARFKVFNDQIEASREVLNPIESAVWSRASEKASKLALIWACSESHEHPEIREEAADWGCRLSEYLTEKQIHDAQRWVSDNPFDKRQKDLVRAIEDAGGSMSLTNVNRRLASIPERVRDEILNNLVKTGKLKVREIKTTKRPRTEYYL